MKSLLLCFVSLFVAVDAIGVLPMFIALTQGIEARAVRRITSQSVLTAAGVGLAFLALGAGVFRLLGITISDFMVAGGTLLFIISISDLLSAQKRQRRVDPESLGAVPLGVPLITGPAVLTTSALLLNERGFFPTAAALIANILVAGFIFSFAHRIYQLLGKAGARTLSKVTSLLLAAIGVMMVRRGIMLIVTGS